MRDARPGTKNLCIMRLQLFQLSQAHEAEWKEYVADKRRYESERNALKWEEMKTSLRKSQWLLEKSLREKDERTAKLRRQIEEQKVA